MVGRSSDGGEGLVVPGEDTGAGGERAGSG